MFCGTSYHDPVACASSVELLGPIIDFSRSGWSAVSPGEKHIVVSNLFDGLDFYSVADRALSHSIPCPINQQENALIPVLFRDNGSTIIVGGTSGSVRVLDSSSYETLQVLSRDGQVFASSGCFLELIVSTGDVIQAIVRAPDAQTTQFSPPIGLMQDPRGDSDHSGWGFGAGG